MLFAGSDDNTQHREGDNGVACVDQEEPKRPSFKQVMRSDKHCYPSKACKKSIKGPVGYPVLLSEEHRQVKGGYQPKDECGSEYLQHVAVPETFFRKSVFFHPGFAKYGG